MSARAARAPGRHSKGRGCAALLFAAAALVAAASPRPLPATDGCAACHGAVEGARLERESGWRLMGRGDRGVGFTDKGEIANVHGNYGLLSDFHFFAPALHWPSNGTEVQQYGFGVGFFVALGGNVIASFADPTTQVESFDWEALDGSRGNLFASDRVDNNTASDGTPFLAHSDIRESWPESGGDAFWPGPWRIDVDSTSATFGAPVAGEFTSDRDIFGVFDDSDNAAGARGIVVRQSTYTYDRPYAQDFFFLDFWIRNASGEMQGTTRTDLQGVYAGLMADIKNDFNNDDLIGTAKIDADAGLSPINFVYEFDSNGIAENTVGDPFEDWVGPVAWSGVGLLQSPGDRGITNFHYFDDNYSPIRDEELWPVITSDPTDAHIDSSLYFHGSDPHIDTDSLSGAFLDPDPTDERAGADITFLFATGPFDIAAGDSVRVSIVFAMGEDSTDLFQNAEQATMMARDLYFQGSNPPATPHLSGVAGDGKATLYWNAEPSEPSLDIRTGAADFEGYRLYRSTDRGRTWGDPITDALGQTVGYVPIAQFDLPDSVTGIDPVGGRDLGNDGGLAHSYVDEGLVNGIEYWYCVTAYDRGVPEENEPSYENGLGRSTFEPHVVSLTPGVDPSNLVAGSAPEGALDPIGGACEGTVTVEIIDPSLLNGHEYEITFNDTDVVTGSGEDTTTVTETLLNLYDRTAGTFDFIDNNTGETFTFRDFATGDDALPVVDGFRVLARDIEEEGARSIGWTVVQGDTSTFDWWTENRTGNISEFPEVVLSTDDWIVEITPPDQTISVAVTDGPALSNTIEEFDDLPLRIWKVTGADTTDVSAYLQVIDLRVAFPESEFIGPLGWDLVPGGKGYNGTGAGDVWPDLLRLRDRNTDWENEVWVRTQNGPEGAIPPSTGDKFTVVTFKPFREGISYRFRTTTPQTPAAAVDLDAIRVVPNPYIVTAGWAQDRFDRRLQFNHLPDACTIDIYTVSGDLVDTVEHDDGSGSEFWNLTNRNGQSIAYGLYVYVVKTPGGGRKVGKFLVIK